MKKIGDGSKRSGKFTRLSIAQEFANAACHFLREHPKAKPRAAGGKELPIDEETWQEVLKLEYTPEALKKQKPQLLKKYCEYYNNAAHGHGYDLNERFDCGTGKRIKKRQNKGKPVKDIDIELAAHPGQKPLYLKPMQVIQFVRARLTKIPTKNAKAAAKLVAKSGQRRASRRPATRKPKSKANGFDFATTSAVEGIRREIRLFARTRSRPLRDRKLAKSNGKCEACKRDFSKILRGNGTRVLLVHHNRRQLSEYDAGGHVTKEEDLAVVCANCHMLIHIDPQKPMDVKVLSRKLRGKWSIAHDHPRSNQREQSKGSSNPRGQASISADTRLVVPPLSPCGNGEKGAGVNGIKLIASCS